MPIIDLNNGIIINGTVLVCIEGYILSLKIHLNFNNCRYSFSNLFLTFIYKIRSALDAEAQKQDAIAKGETLPEQEKFDSNCITPGFYHVCEFVCMSVSISVYMSVSMSVSMSWSMSESIIYSSVCT